MKAALNAIVDRFLSEPVLDAVLFGDLLNILVTAHNGQPISNALIQDAVATLLAIIARSKVTPVRNLPPASPATP